jgi:RHS repeat-associated protein
MSTLWRRSLSVPILATASLLVAGLLCAQDGPTQPVVERGFAADKAYQFLGIDSIDLGTGTVNVAIPIGPKYPLSSSFSYGLTLFHNSSVWDFETVEGYVDCLDDPVHGCPELFTQAFPTKTSNAGLGWRLSLGDLYDPADTDNPEEGGWVFVSPDGAQHRFFHELHHGEEPVDDPDTWYTHDGSYLRLIHVDPEYPNYLEIRRIDLPDGSVYTFAPDGAAKWKLIRIEDAFGNHVLVSATTSGGHLSKHTITDSHGRVHVIDYEVKIVDGEQIPYVEKVRLDGFGGGTSEYQFIYSPSTQISRSARDDDDHMIHHPQTSETVNVFFLLRVEFPETTVGEPLDARSFSFGYCLDDTTCGYFNDVKDAPGMLDSARYPTGGWASWEYQTWSYLGAFALDPCPDLEPPYTCTKVFNDEWAGIKTKTLTDRAPGDPGAQVIGTWSYDTWVEPNGSHLTVPTLPEERRTIVTSPDGDDTVHYYRALPWVNGSAFDAQLIMWDYMLPYTRRVTDSTGNRYLSVEYYDGQVTVDPTDEHLLIGTKLRSTYVAYQPDEFDPYYGDAFYRHVNRHQWTEMTVFHDDMFDDGGTQGPEVLVPRWASVDHTDFDGFGHFRTSATDGNFVAANVRTTTTNFNPDTGSYPGQFTMIGKNDRWILGTYDWQEQSEGAATARQEYEFGADGELKRQRIIAADYTTDSASRGIHDIVVTYEYNSGNPTKEKYFGGDLQTLPNHTHHVSDLDFTNVEPWTQVDHGWDDGVLTTTRHYDRNEDVAGWSLVQREYLSVEREIDSSTGLVKRTYDTSGRHTDYEYDERFRLTWVQPETGLPEGNDAWVEYQYVPQTVAGVGPEVEVYQRPNGSTTGVLAQEGYEYDTLGRVVHERRLVPESENDSFWTGRTTNLNAQGWVLERSEWGTTDHKTKFEDFDPFGRAERIELPDGSVITRSHTGVSSVAETKSVWSDVGGTPQSVATTVEQVMDRQGRVRYVHELGGVGSSGITTEHHYRVGGQLDSVQVLAPGNKSQLRLFEYDNRGFLLAERLPEKGSNGNGWVYYSNHDVHGNAGLLHDGDVRLVSSYDGTGRILGTNALTTCDLDISLSSFAYDPNTGQLAAASRLNYFDGVEAFCTGNRALSGALIFADGFEDGTWDAWNYTVTADDTLTIAHEYTYGGRGGRVSSVTTTVASEESVEEFTQGYSWDELGALETLTYPTLSGFTEPTEALPSVTNSYRLGHLTAVSDFVASVQYHPNGAVKEVWRTNGRYDAFWLDLHHMQRPRRINAAVLDTRAVVWSTGEYQYDGSGNVKAIGANDFVYDELHRLVRGEVDDGTDAQKYAYDSFGNLTYMHARYFSPVLGRFLSVDPVLGDTSSSQNWNRYSYVWNNPLNAVDPLGATVFLVAYTTGNSRGDEEFRRAAETRAEEIRQRNGFDPDSDTVLLRGVKSKADFVAALDEANALDSQYGEVGELSLFSHSGPEDGPIFHDSAGASSQLNKQEAMGLDINWAHDATATFYSCNSADNFSSMFAHAQGVETFGFQNYTYFSSDPDRRVGPHSSGPLYLIDAPGYRNGRFSGWLHLKRGTAYSRPPVGVDPEWVWK